MIGLDTRISKPLAYTSNTFYLLLTDILLFVHLSITWPLTAGLLSIVLPFQPCGSGPLDELYFSWRDPRGSGPNIKDDVVHTILFIAQIVFLISLVCFIFMGIPTALYFGYIAAFMVGNFYFCQWFLNGPSDRKFFAGEEFAKNPKEAGEKWISKDPSHDGEKWVLINGVAVGSHWMSSNLKRLSKTFRRPILGIHNPSFGIPFDVLECMIQRTFAYPTLDIRNAYTTLSTLLADDSIKKLVLIAHSQGAIEAGMVLDWLYATIPLKQVAKLEVFTFGNAANHWNCPIVKHGPVIKHVEHYANDGDWVARFGILHFRQPIDTNDDVTNGDSSLGNISEAKQPQTPQTPILPGDGVKKMSTWELEMRRWKKNRFFGRMFKRVNCSGHQLNQHYLDNMFVMDKKLERVLDGDNVQVGVDNFMEMDVDQEILKKDDTVIPIGFPSGRAHSTGNGDQTRTRRGREGVNKKVKDYSRLWLYKNGETPEDWMYHGRETW